MTKLDAGLMTSLPASDPGSAAVWGSKRINPRPQFCLCLAWSGCPSNDDDDDQDKSWAPHQVYTTCVKTGLKKRIPSSNLVCQWYEENQKTTWMTATSASQMSKDSTRKTSNICNTQTYILLCDRFPLVIK